MNNEPEAPLSKCVPREVGLDESGEEKMLYPCGSVAYHFFDDVFHTPYYTLPSNGGMTLLTGDDWKKEGISVVQRGKYTMRPLTEYTSSSSPNPL